MRALKLGDKVKVVPHKGLNDHGVGTIVALITPRNNPFSRNDTSRHNIAFGLDRRGLFLVEFPYDPPTRHRYHRSEIEPIQQEESTSES